MKLFLIAVLVLSATILEAGEKCEILSVGNISVSPQGVWTLSNWALDCRGKDVAAYQVKDNLFGGWSTAELQNMVLEKRIRALEKKVKELKESTCTSYDGCITIGPWAK